MCTALASFETTCVYGTGLYLDMAALWFVTMPSAELSDSTQVMELRDACSHVFVWMFLQIYTLKQVEF